MITNTKNQINEKHCDFSIQVQTIVKNDIAIIFCSFI